MVSHNILVTSNMGLLINSFQLTADTSENVVTCESTIIFENSSHYIVHKKCEQTDTETACDIFITMEKIEDEWKFVRGYLYQDGKETEICDYIMWHSIQLGLWCYDRVGICFYQEPTIGNLTDP